MQDPSIVYVMGMEHPELLSFHAETGRILYRGRPFFIQMPAFRMSVWNELDEIAPFAHLTEEDWALRTSLSFMKAIQAMVDVSVAQQTDPCIHCPEPPEDIRVGERCVCLVEAIISPTDSRKVVFKGSVFDEV